MASGGGDGSSGVIVQGVCKIKKQNYSVSLTTSDLSWQLQGGKKDVKSVRVSDILSTKIQKSKNNNDALFVSFVQVQKKLVLKKCVVEFTSDDEGSLQQFHTQISQLLNDDKRRPKRVLVIINPVSGRSKGRSVYTKTVAPIFQEVGIQTDVIVTERAHHTEEILSTYDLNSINGLVIVGGDGTYHEAVNGLFKRLMKERGLNIDDVNSDVPPIDFPIGLIPTGTGNGIALFCYGNYDAQTAAISIAIGYRMYSNIYSIHSGGRHISYSILLIGSGMWGDIIHTAENRRSQGILRYPITMSEFAFFKRLRQIPVTVQYRYQSEKTWDSETVGDTSTDTSSQWLTHTDTMIGGTSFICGFQPSQDIQESSFDDTYFSVMRPCSKWKVAKFFVALFAQTLDPFSMPDVVTNLKGTEWKVSLTSPSDPQSQNGILEHYINIDGEPIVLPHTDFHFKRLSKKVSLFCNLPSATGRPKPT